MNFDPLRGRDQSYFYGGRCGERHRKHWGTRGKLGKERQSRSSENQDCGSCFHRRCGGGVKPFDITATIDPLIFCWDNSVSLAFRALCHPINMPWQQPDLSLPQASLIPFYFSTCQQHNNNIITGFQKMGLLQEADSTTVTTKPRWLAISLRP